MREVFATTKWTVYDILRLRPDWTLTRASEFLANIESKVEEAMVTKGWNVIQNELNIKLPKRQ